MNKNDKDVDLNQNSEDIDPARYKKKSLGETSEDIIADYSISEITKTYSNYLGKSVSTIGRVVGHRNSRMFIILRKGLYKIQCVFVEESLKTQRKQIDTGDILFVEGIAKYSDTHEQSIFVSRFYILSKCVTNINTEYDNQEMVSEKYFHRTNRTRYLTLNRSAHSMLLGRFKIIKSIREYMYTNNYTEVDTNVLQEIAGGAKARPFKTYCNSSKKDMFLRIAPELYLKRLVIAGYSKVFEIAKNFRNEGCSAFHNPEFTMMECYTTNITLNQCIDFCIKLILFVQQQIIHDPEIEEKLFTRSFDGTEILKKDFIEILDEEYSAETQYHVNPKKYIEEIIKISGIDINDYEDKSDALESLVGNIIKKKYNNGILCVKKLLKGSNPLAKSDDLYCHRFEIYIHGVEIFDGFQEINCFKQQEENFIEQSKETGQQYDEQYIKDLMLGMEPTVGFGMGIDRFICLCLSQKNIRSCIPFIN